MKKSLILIWGRENTHKFELGDIWVRTILAVLLVIQISACSKRGPSPGVYEVTAQAIACTSTDRLRQLAVVWSEGNSTKTLNEISKSRQTGECQYVFIGNKISVIEYGEVFSKIANPGNDLSPNRISGGEWYVMSEQVRFKKTSESVQ